MKTKKRGGLLLQKERTTPTKLVTKKKRHGVEKILAISAGSLEIIPATKQVEKNSKEFLIFKIDHKNYG